MTRMMVDCRTTPSELNCSLSISGTAEEVVKAAVQHAIDAHGHEDTPALHEEVEASLRDASDGLGTKGAFVQLVEFHATAEQLEQGMAVVDSWQKEIGDARTARWWILAADRDHADTYLQVVEFPSYEEAMANSDHPATKALAEQLGKISSGTTYRNLDVLQVDSEI